MMSLPAGSTRRRSPSLAARRGATLVEVLMSLMVMGIGIVSVVTMFPIAALRSIQATQLTNAKMLRKNAEEAFRMPYQSSATPPVRFDFLDDVLDTDHRFAFLILHVKPRLPTAF